ncbi:MAG: DUF4824 family protein [Burkholderiales bacterium]|nr:DUF4824 family protein [Burkholderiales bacterium]
MSRLVVAALVLLLTIGGLLGAAAWNRGASRAFTLTERELALPQLGWRYDSHDSERVLRLAWRWQQRAEPQDARLWLPDARLRELGFPTGLPAGSSDAANFYDRTLPRTAWVAFEYDGPAWQAVAAPLAMRSPYELRTGSRLVPIDAGLDADRLRERHASSAVLVLPAVIRMHYRNDAMRGPSVWAMVKTIDPGDVSVPSRLRDRLERFRSSNPAPFSPQTEATDTPYEVTVRVGRLGSVWIENVRDR